MDSSKSVVTLTFGDSAENHVGMEKIGDMVAEGGGFQVEELYSLYKELKAKGLVCEFTRLDDVENPDQASAAVLVLRGGVDAMLSGLGKTKVDLFEEQAALDVDKKAYMYGRVVNKNARWNLCFDEKSREPDYEAGKGRIVGFDEVPLTKHLREELPKWFGLKADGLKCEGNYYYDLKKCGIGFHGDSERRKVVGVRLGGSTDMHWQWFVEGEAVGERICIPLSGGDVYVMSEKAVGTDWKKKKIFTLRHATGCNKFTTI